MISFLLSLSQMPGVIAAGEYSYRGDRFSYEGKLTSELARMASIMCRATTLATHMQVDMLKSLGMDYGCAPARGWMVRGEHMSVCVVGNVFCFAENASADLSRIMQHLQAQVSQQEGQLV